PVLPASATPLRLSFYPLPVTVIVDDEVAPNSSFFVYFRSHVLLFPPTRRSSDLPGSNTTLPSTIDTLPAGASDTDTSDSTWPSSGSVSLATASIVTALFSPVLAESATAVGPSFSPLTVTVIVDDDVAPNSSFIV